MKISVITASYNSERTIAYAIESFLSQNHPNKEMLILDGSSKDDTLKIVEAFRSPDIRVHSEPDRGVYDAMNKGLDLYSGDATGFLNSDDAFHDAHALARIAETLQGSDITYGDLAMVSDHEVKHVVRFWRAGTYGRRSFQYGWMPPHPTFYVRRAVIERVGKFDLGYAIAADYDFMIRAMMLYDFRVRYTPHTIVDFKVGGKSTRNWRATLTTNLESLRARRTHLHAPLVDLAFVLRPLRRIFQIRDIGAYFVRQTQQ